MDFEPHPIEGDPSRQANKSLEGYLYQIWRSLEYWISLEDDEVLYLERAEDIDFYNADGATVIQVKDVANPITLRSPIVTTSLNNFWRYKKEKDGHIRFRLLTTSRRGTEQGSHFDRQSGLDYWDACKGEHDLQPLINFLTQELALDSDLNSFLTSETHEIIRECLIRRFDWDTDSPGFTEIKRSIENKLILLGERFGYTPSECIKAVTSLLEYTTGVASRENAAQRCLCHADFLRVFEEAVMIGVHPSTLRRLTNQASLLFPPNITGAEFQPTFESSEWLPSMTSSQLLPPTTLHRKNIVDNIASILIKHGVAVITGTSGIGKSTIANLAATAINGEWRLLTLRGYDSETIQSLFTRLYSSLSHDTRYNLVIDDLNDTINPQRWAQSLLFVLQRLKHLGGKIIVTSYNALPTQISTTLNLPDTTTIGIPLLTEGEIKDLLINHNCPTEIFESITTILHRQTSGHPQLVHAHIRYLSSNSWQIRNPFNLHTTSPEIGEILREAHKELQSTIPTKEALALVLRLGVFFSSFSLRQVTCIAQAQPRIISPKLALDALRGPFVEKIGPDRYRLSPLLENITKENHTEDQLILLHQSAGESFIQQTMHPSDVSDILMHGFAGHSIKLVRFGTSIVYQTSEEDWPVVHPHLAWLTSITLKDKLRAFELPTYDIFMIHLTQFRVALSENQSKRAVDIAEACSGHLDKSRNTDEQVHPHLEHGILELIFLAKVFMTSGVKFPIALTIDWFRKADTYNSQSFAELKNPSINLNDWIDVRTYAFDFLIDQVHLSADRGQELLYIIESISEILNPRLDADNDLGARLVDSLWFDIKDYEQDRISTSLKAAIKLYNIVDAQKNRMLSVALARTIAIIEHELKKDRRAAEKVLDESSAQYDTEPYLITDYRAHIHFYSNEHRQALTYWDRCLPHWTSVSPIALAMKYRNAGVSALEIDDIDKATSYFDAAIHYAKKGRAERLEFQYTADLAYCAWINDQLSDSISSIANLIEALSTPANMAKYPGLIRSIGHFVLWMRGQHDPNTAYAEMVELKAGFFSDFNIQESMSEIENLNPINLLVMLAHIEHKLRLGNFVFHCASPKERQLDFLFLGDFKLLKIHKMLRSGDVSDMFNEWLHWLETVSEYTQNNMNSEREQLLDKVVSDLDSILIPLAIAGVISLHSVNREIVATLEQWKSTLNQPQFSETTKQYEGLVIWITQLCEDLNKTEQRLKDTVLTQGTGYYSKLSSATALMLKAVQPRHYFVGTIMIFDCLTDFGKQWADSIELEFSDLLERRWRHFCQNSRFALTSPDHNCEQAQEAFSSHNGMVKAAKILLIAKRATNVNIGDVLLTKLRKFQAQQTIV